MVARTRPERELILVFSRAGTNDTGLVSDGKRATATAITMIAGRGALYAGDRPTMAQHDDSAV